MYKKYYPRLFFIVVALLLLLSACKAIKYAQRDPFYNDGSDWDHLRFPLIKPYYATWSTHGLGWAINLHVSPLDKDIYYYLSLLDVQKIAVENGVIMVYTPYEESVDEDVGQKVLYWFAIVPHQNIETGFETEAELLDYIQQYGIDKPDWRDPDDISLEYDQTWCLDWIPDCE
jgi:hypothetical protein